MEQLSPRDLAARIKATPPQNKEKHADRGIDDMIEAAQRVWQCLRGGVFEADENGFLKTEIIDTSDSDYDGRPIVGGIDIRFTDATGYSVRLGGIRVSRTGKPAAEVNISPSETEQLFPSDERWDAVVGAIGRAILSCAAEKPSK